MLTIPRARVYAAAPEDRGLSAGESGELAACAPFNGAPGFVRFCERHVIIQDRDSGREVPFDLFPGQRRITPLVHGPDWLFILKGRQLGVTWYLVVYVLWRMIFSRMFLALVINQSKDYAADFIRRMKWVYLRLPRWAQFTITKDRDFALFASSGGRAREVRAIVGSAHAGRGFAGELAIIDEGAYVPDLAETFAALTPALSGTIAGRPRGKLILLGTADGPSGDYHEIFRRTYGDTGELLDAGGLGPTKLRVVFMHYSERPGRDQAWYEAERARLDAVSPVKMKHEHPETIEEAWEHAEGRVFALFTRSRHVGRLIVPPHAKRFRAIDWGESKSAYVVLWIAYLPGPPGLLVDPECPNTIREFLSYRLGEDGRPMEGQDDHTCDALRYAVVTHNLRGLVYVYREIYRLDSVELGWSPMQEIAEIHKLSGWLPAPPASRKKWVPGPKAEQYDLVAVADRSLGKVINEFNLNGIPTIPAARIESAPSGRRRGQDRPKDEVVDGCRAVAALIEGSYDLSSYQDILYEDQAVQLYGKLRAKGVPVPRITESQIRNAAREMLLRLKTQMKESGDNEPA